MLRAPSHTSHRSGDPSGRGHRATVAGRACGARGGYGRLDAAQEQTLTPPALRRPSPRTRGPRDALLQVALVVVAYLGYELVGGLSAGHPGAAFAHARDLIGAERALGALFEVDAQRLVLGHSWLMHAASWIYIDGHFAVTSAVLLWVYLRRQRCFACVRNAFIVAMGIALVVYAAYPVAPPRSVTELGAVDTLRTVSGIDQDHGSLQALVNPYAAVPSMHVAFALLTAGTVVALAPWRPVRLLALAYPVLIFLVVVVTGNHLWIDAVAGAAVAVLSAAAARYALARLRPGAWGWPAAGAVPAGAPPRSRPAAPPPAHAAALGPARFALGHTAGPGPAPSAASGPSRSAPAHTAATGSAHAGAASPVHAAPARCRAARARGAGGVRALRPAEQADAGGGRA